MTLDLDQAHPTHFSNFRNETSLKHGFGQPQIEKAHKSKPH